jgi:hypothetical protein
MTKEQFDREKTYQAALAVARAMLTQGLIDDGDMSKLEAHFCRKFCPLIGAFQGANP